MADVSAERPLNSPSDGVTGKPMTLPERSVLVHIGPGKTGTTAIQVALHQARERLAECGVQTVASQQQASLAARWICDGAPRPGAPVPTERAWRRLVELVHAAADDRVVVSSEFFAKGRHAAIQRVVQELGAQRVHVVVTLRPLSRILASSWQQAVQNGLRVPYEQWLEATLRPGPAGMTPRFWLAHDHARLVRKWSSAAGAGRLSVIIVDPSDPRMLPEAFERLLSLPTGMLECAADVTNRSLSAAEAELVRRLNELCAAAEVDEDLRGRLVRDGVSRHLKEAYRLGPEDSPITTPDWALDCAAARDRATAEAIQRLEVRVIGEVTALTRPAERLDVPDLSRVSIEAAAQAALGVVLATQAWRAAPGEERPLRIVTSRELARVVARRAAKRLLRRRVVARPNPAP